MSSRTSISFYVCAALLVAFGLWQLNGYDPGTAQLQTGLGVVVALAGVYLQVGGPNAHTLGLVVLACVIALGFFELVQGRYTPGVVVAGFALYRMVVGGPGSSAPARQPTWQTQYGQPKYGQPQPPPAWNPQFGPPPQAPAPPFGAGSAVPGPAAPPDPYAPPPA